jgi:hypothetical protein
LPVDRHVERGLGGFGNFFECYEAVLVGTHSYYVTVTDKRTGKPRETHTYTDPGTIGALATWKAGDELVVCNSVITNKTRNSSAPCGDLGCLALWP